MFNLKGLFTREAIAQYLKNLPMLKTPVIDTMFSDRPQIPFAVVGSDMVNEVIRAMPLVQRGKGSISIPGGEGATTWYEPLPINPDVFVTAAELNNLKMVGEGDRQKWARRKTDQLRRTIRATCEAMAATAKSGTLSWPVQLESGVFVPYTVEFGTPVGADVPKLFTATDAKITHVFETLENMREALEENGYGSSVAIWAGKTTYGALLALAGNFTSTAKMKVELTNDGISIGGYLVRRRSEKYRNPETKAMVAVVADNDLEMIALDAGHKMPYCAVDDLDANLQPLPMFIKPIESKNPSGYQLVGQSKPFASPNMKGICKVTVCA